MVDQDLWASTIVCKLKYDRQSIQFTSSFITENILYDYTISLNNLKKCSSLLIGLLISIR